MIRILDEEQVATQSSDLAGHPGEAIWAVGIYFA
jgi:hypothetical protein